MLSDLFRAKLNLLIIIYNLFLYYNFQLLNELQNVFKKFTQVEIENELGN